MEFYGNDYFEGYEFYMIMMYLQKREKIVQKLFLLEMIRFDKFQL